jgi:hypothetical protein
MRPHKLRFNCLRYKLWQNNADDSIIIYLTAEVV